MPQFDFVIIPKLLNFGCAVLLFIAFISLFLVALPYWLRSACKIAFSVLAINEIKWISTRLSNAPLFILSYLDVMEQFVLTPKLFFFTAVGFVIIFGCLILFFFPVFTLLYRFTGELAQNILSENKDFAQKITIFLFVVFISVLYTNFTGLVPGAYTFTSSLIIPGFLSFTIFFYWFSSLARNYKFSALAGLVPAGTRNAITPLVAVIELISNFAKFISLGVRLFANMFAGHLLLKVLYSAVFLVLTASSVLSLCLAVLVAGFTLFIIVLETMIAFLQAYVFLLLTTIYLRDVKLFVSAH